MHTLRRALTPARALLLAALLLLAQAAGLAHRVAHAGHSATPAVQANATAHGHCHGHGHGLADHQQAGTECRLYDQLLGQVDALPATPAVAVAVPDDRSPATAAPATACAARTAAYQARAPPVA